MNIDLKNIPEWPGYIIVENKEKLSGVYVFTDLGLLIEKDNFEEA